MKKMLLFLILGAVVLFNIDRQGFAFVVLLMVFFSPFMVAYWIYFLRNGGKPVEVEREGDIHILQEEIRKQGVADDIF